MSLERAAAHLGMNATALRKPWNAARCELQENPSAHVATTEQGQV
jgi:transposase-like protein